MTEPLITPLKALRHARELLNLLGVPDDALDMAEILQAIDDLEKEGQRGEEA